MRIFTTLIAFTICFLSTAAFADITMCKLLEANLLSTKEYKVRCSNGEGGYKTVESVRCVVGVRYEYEDDDPPPPPPPPSQIDRIALPSEYEDFDGPLTTYQKVIVWLSGRHTGEGSMLKVMCESVAIICAERQGLEACAARQECGSRCYPIIPGKY